MNALTDELIRARVLASAVGGDEVAFAQIVDAHSGDMARVAYLVCGEVDVAHEAVQAAWVIAWRKLGSVRDPQRLKSWLVSVAANEARQAIRRRRVRPVVEIAADAGDPTSDTARTDTRLDLARALLVLSPEDRAIVAMRYALGLTSDEIATATGRSAVGVRSRLARGLARLRKEVGDD